MQISISVDGAETTRIELLKYAGRADEARPALRAVADFFREVEEAQFAGEGSRGPAGPWEVLSPTYAAWKAAHFPGEPILQRTHALIDSLTKPRAPGSVEDLSDDELFVGTEVYYARFHQSKEPRTKLPRRPPVDLTQRDERNMVQIVQRYIEKGEVWSPGLLL